jgi:hypothetical protein
MSGVGVDVDAGSFPGDPGQEEVNKIIKMLLDNPSKINEFKAALNIQPDKDKSKMLLDDHTFRRIEKFSGLTGTWPEWSFGVSMTAATVDKQLGQALDEIKTKAAMPMDDRTFGCRENTSGAIGSQISESSSRKHFLES